MASTGFLDAALVSSFLLKLTQDYKKWDAFKSGVIDENGNILVKPKERTETQRKSFKMYDLMVLRLRNILAKVPGGSTSFARYSAALFLVTETFNDESDVQALYENFVRNNLEKITEELANTTSGIASPESPNSFAGARVFDVDFETVWGARFGKKHRSRYKKYIDEEKFGTDIKDFCKTNPKKSVILRDQKTGQMVYFRRK